MKIERDYEKDYQETLPSGPQSSRRVQAPSRAAVAIGSGSAALVG